MTGDLTLAIDGRLTASDEGGLDDQGTAFTINRDKSIEAAFCDFLSWLRMSRGSIASSLGKQRKTCGEVDGGSRPPARHQARPRVFHLPNRLAVPSPSPPCPRVTECPAPIR